MHISKIVEILERAWEEGLTLDVTYTNSYGTTNEYQIWDIEPDREYGNGRICEEGYIKAYCGYKDDEEYDEYYTFKIERFESIDNIYEEEDEGDRKSDLEFDW